MCCNALIIGCRLRVMFLNPLVIASSKLFIALWNSELVGPLYIIVEILPDSLLPDSLLYFGFAVKH